MTGVSREVETVLVLVLKKEKINLSSSYSQTL